MKIEVFADGSATIATKPGGYGWVIVVDGVKHSEGSGRIENATNNDAELEAAIMGLANVLKVAAASIEGWPRVGDLEVTLVSDSQIILGWANGKNRFKQKKKMHKFQALQHLVKKLQVQTRWVEGHSGDEHNSRCDKLANWARKGMEEPKPQKKKKKSVATVNLGIAINEEKLYGMVKAVFDRMMLSSYAPMSPEENAKIFAGRLKEQMENGEYFSITVRT